MYLPQPLDQPTGRRLHHLLAGPGEVAKPVVGNRTRSWSLFLLAGLLPFLVYLRTLTPTITWHNDGDDSGDLAAAVAVGGVPHPPGYPTYLLLGTVFNRLPFGDSAYRLNLLSATSAALAIAILALIICQTLIATGESELGIGNGGSVYICALSASLTLAFSSTFWSQAVIAEVYTLNALFVALLFYGILSLRPANERWQIPALACLLGLGLGNHLSVLFLAPLLLSLNIRWSWQQGLVTVLALAVGLSVYLIIPLRAATLPPINWGLATTWPNFLWLVSAEPYRPLVFGLPWSFVPVRVGLELHLLAESFMGWGLLVGLLGLHQLFRIRLKLALATLLSFLLISLYAIGYNTSDSYVYLLPALLIFTWWLGYGLYSLSQIGRRWLPPSLDSALIWSLLLLPVLSLGLNFAGQDLSRDKAAYEYARQSLQSLPPQAILVAEEDPQTFALWYVRYGMGLRSDVAVVNSHLLAYEWYRQTLQQTHPGLQLADQAGQPVTTLPTFIELNFAESPIYLDLSQPSILEGYRLETFNHLQRVVALNQ